MSASRGPAAARNSGGRIVHRYARLVALLVAVTAGTIGAADVYLSYRENLARAAALQQAEARGAAARIDEHVKTLVAQIADVARLPWASGVLTSEDHQQEFHRLLKLQPAVFELTAVDAGGLEVLFASRLGRDRVGGGQSLAADPLLARMGERSVVASGAEFKFGTDPYVRIAIRERPGAGDTTIAEINLRFIADIVKQLTVGQSGRAYVVDDEDRLLAHPDLSLMQRKADLSGLEQHAQIRALARGAGAPAELTAWGTNAVGVRVMATAAAVPSTGWRVFVEQPATEVLQPVVAAALSATAIVGAGIVLACLLGVFLARHLVRPILAVQRGAARIGEGELGTRIEVHTGDEVEDLARGFNEMAGQLQEYASGLERKVAEKTQALEGANRQVRQQASELQVLHAELTRRFAELGVKKEEADRANAAKTRFLASASHDLRQPMHTISLLVGILRERMGSGAEANLVGKVQLAVHAMENLFNSLLDISKLDAGAVEPVITDCPMATMLELIEASYAPQAQQKGLALRVVPSRAVVRSDPVLLERILGNLVANAIRYTDRGRVLVGCWRHADALRILVIDTGVGIPAEHLDDIFEEFFQLANPERDRSKGLGLGLSIVKRSVALLGHKLTVHSQPGKGSTFAIEVPLVRDVPARAAAAAAPSKGGGRLESAFVVVIDDEPENRLAMEALCVQWKCHVVSAGSADEALAALSGHLRAPDLIVTDFRLRDQQTGLSAIERIREQADEAIPAMIVTGDISTADVAKLDASGYALLHKPANPDTLRAAMERLLSGSRGAG